MAEAAELATAAADAAATAPALAAATSDAVAIAPAVVAAAAEATATAPVAAKMAVDAAASVVDPAAADADAAAAAADAAALAEQVNDENGIFDGLTRALMNNDRETNENIEKGLYGFALVLTLISGKLNYDDWKIKNDEQEFLRKQKTRAALSTDLEWKKEIRQMEKMEAAEMKSRVAAKSFKTASSKGKARRTTARRKKQTPLDEVIAMDEEDALKPL